MPLYLMQSRTAYARRPFQVCRVFLRQSLSRISPSRCGRFRLPALESSNPSLRIRCIDRVRRICPSIVLWLPRVTGLPRLAGFSSGVSENLKVRRYRRLLKTLTRSDGEHGAARRFFFLNGGTAVL